MYLLSFLLAVTVHRSQAQVVLLGDSTRQSGLVLNECGSSDTFSTFIRVASGSLSGTTVLNDTFLSNYVFTGVVSGQAAVLSVSGTGTNIGKITLDPAVLNAAGSTGVYIKYLVRAKCGANGLSTAKHTLLFTSAGTGYSQVKLGQDFVSSNKAATLILEARNTVSNPNGAVGNTYTRYWRIRNTGTGSEIDTVWFRVKYQAGLTFSSLVVDGVTVSPTVVHLDSIWYRIIKPLRNQSLYPADTVFVRETYLVSNCTVSSGTSKVSVYYGCGSSPICTESVLNPSTQTPTVLPNVLILNDVINYSHCWGAGSPDTGRMVIKNNGAGPATSLFIRSISAHASNSVQSTGAWYYQDTSSVRYKIGKNGVWKHIKLDSFRSNNQTRYFIGGSYPDGKAGEMYYSIPLLSAGDTAFIEWFVIRPCLNCIYNYAKPYNNYFDAGWNTISYKDQCGAPFATTAPSGWTNGFYTGFEWSPIDYPTDLNNGDTGYLTVKTLLSFLSGPYNTIGTKRGFYEFSAIIPPGLKFANVAGALTWGNKAPNSVVYNSSTRTVTARYNYQSANIAALHGLNNVTLGFYVDCSDPAYHGGPVSVKYNFSAVYDSACATACRIYWACNDSVVILPHCPGPCSPRGGYSPFAYEYFRQNLGAGDALNNGTANGTLDLSKIKRTRLMPGDTLFTRIKGTVSVGGQTPAGGFTNGYMQTKMTESGSSIVPVNGTVYIKDISTGTTYSCAINVVNTVTSGTTRTFIWDFSPGSLSCGTGYTMADGDSIFVTTRYRIASNQSSCCGNFVYVPIIDNKTYLSNRVYSAITNDTQKYFCSYYNGLINNINYYYDAGGLNPTTTMNGCGPFVFRTAGNLRVGSQYTTSGTDYFPFEFRGEFYPDTVRIKLPPQWNLDSVRFNITRTVGNASTVNKWIDNANVTYWQSGGDLYVNIAKIFVPNGGTIPQPDGGWEWFVDLYMKPLCDAPTTYLGPSGYNYVTYKRLSSGMSVAEYVQKRYTYDRTQYNPWNRAQLQMSNLGASSITTDSKKGYWDLRLRNTSFIANANNTWFAFVSNSGLITVDSVKNISSNTLLPVSSGVFKAGTIPLGGAFTNYRVYASTLNCALDSLKIISGWACAGYPANLASAIGACRTDSIRVYATPLNPLIQSDLISSPPATVNICDTLQWIVSVSQRQLAAAFNLTLDVVIPDGGTGALIVPPYQYKYPYNAATWTRITPVNLGGGIFRFYLSDSIPAILSNGIRPIGESPNNELYLKVRMVTNCNFTSGSNVRFIARANKACGTALTPDAEYSPIVISGAPAPKVQLLTNVTPGIGTCDKDYSVTVHMVNLETSPTGSSDGLWVTLPSGAYMVTGSVSFSHNGLTPSQPVLDTVGGRQRLKWTATTVPALDSTVLTFKYRSPSNINCGLNDEFKIQTVTQFSSTCGATSCNTFVENSKQELSRPVMKPNLGYVAGSGIMQLLQDTTVGNKYYSDTLLVSGLQFGNTGNDTADKPILRIFHDANNNGSRDPGETVLILDSLAPVLPGGTASYSVIRVWGHKTLPSSNRIKLEISQTCNCSSTTTVAAPPAVYTPLQLNWGYFTAQAAGKTSKLDWMTLSETNTRRFFVQRKLSNQSRFETIGMVQAAGNSQVPLVYGYQDIQTEVLKDVVYYRLQLQNQNGSTELSETRAVTFNGASHNDLFAYWPNPANTQLNISVASEGGFDYRITSVSGQLVGSGSCQTTQCQIDVSQVPAGLYQLTVTDSLTGRSERLVINR